MLPLNQIIQADALTTLQQFEANTIDLVVTDPPYGYSFMSKDWDKAVVNTETWRECLRVLKPGAFAFIMSSPRQDVLSRMICNLQDAGFRTDFTSIYWTYASGFPKAANMSKLVDKRNGRNFDTSFKDYLNERRNLKRLSLVQVNEYLGTALTGGGIASAVMGDKEFNELPTLEIYRKLKTLLDLDDRFDALIEIEEAEREIIGKSNNKIHFENLGYAGYEEEWNITKSATDQAKALDGSYAGFQPKPAVEVILCVMKPLSEKSFTDQALANGKGVTWLDDCRIPYQSESDFEITQNKTNKDLEKFRTKEYSHMYGNGEGLQRKEITEFGNQKGRFPANLLVSDDVLNDGKITKSTGGFVGGQMGVNVYGKYAKVIRAGSGGYGDSGSYSRYFDLDKWYETTFPFAIIPKASKAEKNRGLDQWIPTTVNDGRQTPIDNPFQRGETPRINRHPTVKPQKLMSYLIMLGSRPNDIVLDPFAGSGTTCIAAQQLKRQWIGIELNKEYAEIANARIKSVVVHKATNFFL